MEPSPKKEPGELNAYHREKSKAAQLEAEKMMQHPLTHRQVFAQIRLREANWSRYILKQHWPVLTPKEKVVRTTIVMAGFLKAS